MKKGTRVYVEFDDITASLHSDNDLECVVAQVCGWVISDTKRYLKLATCRYKDGCDYKDRITVPQGCVIKKEKL
jgi:hypothetical protein